MKIIIVRDGKGQSSGENDIIALYVNGKEGDVLIVVVLVAMAFQGVGGGDGA